MGFQLCHRIRHLLTFLLCLLITWNYVKLIAEGRELPRLKNEVIEVVEPSRKAVVVMGRLLIGSRPPRCERRCRSCGHCEAVQVPIVPSRRTRTTVVVNSRGDDISNYKPMCWKCKCGDFMFNP